MDRYDFHPDLRPDVETLLDMQRVFIDQGLVRYSQPLSAARLVDPSFSEFAARTLGPGGR